MDFLIFIGIAGLVVILVAAGRLLERRQILQQGFMDHDGKRFAVKFVRNIPPIKLG